MAGKLFNFVISALGTQHLSLMQAPIAPAFPNDDAFFCRFFTEVSSLRDTANRPLHEVDFRAEGAQTAYQKCPFHDSRRGYLMNKEALVQITGEWEHILQGVRYYTSLYATIDEEKVNLGRAWRICLTSMFAPMYLLHKTERPYANGFLPTPVSGVFKILLDVPTTIDLMFLLGHQPHIASSPDKTMPQQVQSFADENLILLNGEYACAGSPGLIDKILGILFEGISKDTEGVDDFHGYFGQSEKFLGFCYLMSVQYVIGQMYLLSYMTTAEVAFCELQRKDLCKPSNEAEKLSAYERRRRIALKVMSDGKSHDRILRQLVSLVSDPQDWKTDCTAAVELKNALHASLTFLRDSSTLRTQQMVKRFSAFQEEIKINLLSLQKSIEFLLGAENMFPRPLRFTRTQSQPFDLLERLFVEG